MLPSTLITTDAKSFTASVSHEHALGPPQRPTYLPLGRTPSILVNTNNNGDTHDALGFILPHTLYYHPPISSLVRGISHGISLAISYLVQDVLLSLVAAPT